VISRSFIIWAEKPLILKKKTPLFETHTQLYNQFIAIDILFRLKKETIYGAAKYLGVELFRRIENTDVEDRTR